VTWRLGRRVGGPLAGLATLLCWCSARPFTAHVHEPEGRAIRGSDVVLTLGLVRLAEEYPAPSPRTILIIGIGAGLSIGCRILGGLRWSMPSQALRRC